ncbi:MAG: DUF559 domain-containing protein, partial [Baekduia sp.]
MPNPAGTSRWTCQPSSQPPFGGELWSVAPHIPHGDTKRHGSRHRCTRGPPPWSRQSKAAVGRRPLEGHWLAAVWACGADAVLSHGDAAAHWGLAPAHGRLIHVTAPSTSGRAPDRTRIKLHRVGTLRASAFERDRERDQHLTLAGYTVVRFTYKQVTRQRHAVADRIRRL